MIRKTLALTPLLLLLGCPDVPVEGDLVGSQQLSVLLDTEAPNVIGVTIDHATGARYVLQASGQIHELNADGTATPFAVPPRSTEFGEQVNGDWTDFAALGNERFAITARSDGWLYDRAEHTIARHFCYVPGWMPEGQFDQLTHSLTYDPVSDLLYAQPQTFDITDGQDVLTSAQIGTFGGSTGGDLDWFGLADETRLAGGIALDGDDVLLVEDDILLRWNRDNGQLDSIGSLREFGITAADGMVRDVVNDTLLIVDSANDRLVEIRID